jgi:hypothetical protein
MGGGFGTLVGPVGVGVVSLSLFAREVKRLEVIVGWDKWRLSLALALSVHDWSVSCLEELCFRSSINNLLVPHKVCAIPIIVVLQKFL